MNVNILHPFDLNYDIPFKSNCVKKNLQINVSFY